jgi:hypothetical protein
MERWYSLFKLLILKAVDVNWNANSMICLCWDGLDFHSFDYNYNPNKQLTTNDLLKQLKAENGDLIVPLMFWMVMDTQGSDGLNYFPK